MIETDELTILARTLQALIENEKEEVKTLKSKIRALGGNPTHRWVISFSLYFFYTKAGLFTDNI